MAEPFVAEIRIFPFNFAPKGWAFCDGQILPIAQNTALFALLGYTYGGSDNEFALPDLRGRSPMHPGQGPGLSLHDLGELGGQGTVTLLPSEIPAHTHTLRAAQEEDNPSEPNASAVLGPASAAVYRPPADPVAMAGESIGATGGGEPHENRQPFLAFHFTIALQGVFPSGW
jgi:microcystin-dependent protein